MRKNTNNTITIIVIIAACVLGLYKGYRIAEKNAFVNEAIKRGAAYRDAESGKLIWTNEGKKP